MALHNESMNPGRGNAGSGAGEAARGPQGEVRAREVERLFRDHNDSLVRFLTLRLQSRHEAREVAQEAYVRLLQLERSDVAGFLRAYLFRIAGNLAIDRLRRRATESRFQEREMFPGLVERPAEPEAEVIEGERVAQIRRFLHELPDPVREAFLLFRTQDMDQESIARRLGVSDRMVRNHVTRALVYCRLRLDGLGPADAHARLREGQR
jgi:RNA polymerase sigma-70 factor (ECF subfamily)